MTEEHRCPHITVLHPCNRLGEFMAPSPAGDIYRCPKGHTFYLPRTVPPPPVPDPPTGPPAAPYDREDGRPEKYVAFRATEDGEAFWVRLTQDALGALQEGESRFSTRTFLARYRDEQKVRINDHFSPWFADDLVAAYPELLDIVERRARKKRGPETVAHGGA